MEKETFEYIRKELNAKLREIALTTFESQDDYRRAHGLADQSINVMVEAFLDAFVRIPNGCRTYSKKGIRNMRSDIFLYVYSVLKGKVTIVQNAKYINSESARLACTRLVAAMNAVADVQIASLLNNHLTLNDKEVRDYFQYYQRVNNKGEIELISPTAQIELIERMS